MNLSKLFECYAKKMTIHAFMLSLVGVHIISELWFKFEIKKASD